jgi:hypothetical protein
MPRFTPASAIEIAPSYQKALNAMLCSVEATVNRVTPRRERRTMRRRAITRTDPPSRRDRVICVCCIGIPQN